MSASAQCHHPSFDFDVGIDALPESGGTHVIHISAKCAHCGHTADFLGPTKPGPMAAPDRKTVYLPVAI